MSSACLWEVVSRLITGVKSSKYGSQVVLTVDPGEAVTALPTVGFEPALRETNQR